MRLYTTCQHRLGFIQTLRKIADRIDVGIAGTFGLLPKERTHEWYVLRNLTAHRLRQIAIPHRMSWELIETLQRHSGAPQKHRAELILKSKLRNLRWKKV